MSMFKKVLSVVLCLSMLAGSFAMLGNLVPTASAADGTSMVKSYEALEAQYDKFIYLAEEAYEEDADGNLVLTDYYVQPGDWLYYRLYVKSDLYMGNSMPITAYDNTFFDVTSITDAPSHGSNGYEYLNESGKTNANHPMVADEAVTHTVTTKPASTVNQITNGSCDLDVDYNTLDLTYNQWTKDVTVYTYANVMTSDEWLLEWKVLVKDGLEDGTTGVSQIYAGMYKWADGAGNAKRLADISTLDCTDDVPTMANAPKISGAKGMYPNKAIIKNFLVDDTKMTFTIGENPADAGSGSDVPSGPIVGTSMVKSYEALEAEYDKFIYLGQEAYEDDGSGNLILTDYYVQPGDWIYYRLYVKSDLYMGNSMPITAYDNTFFDVTSITDTPSHGSNGYEYLNESGKTNANHPMVADEAVTHTVTTKPASTVNQITNGSCDLDVDYNTLDLTYNQWTKDVTVYTYANVMTSDEWLLEWKVLVKDGLTDGTKGVSQIYAGMYKWADGAGNAKRLADISTLDCTDDVPTMANAPKISGAKGMYPNKAIIKNFLVDDTKMTFTIGENPAASGSTTTKYTATFVDAEGNEIAKTSYEKDAAVTAPEAVEGEIGWANTRDGKLVDFSTFTMPTRNLTFQRVLDTDKFDVAIDLGDGAIPEDAQLPENIVENEDGSLTAKVGFGETLDMSTVPAPEKEGYTAAWDPAEVTIDNINGAKVKAVYTANTYKATFYLNKGDAEPFKVVDIAYGATLSCTGATSEGKKFAGWMDAETDQLVTSNNNLGKYNYTTDKSYYASWTEYSCSITLMVRDYENGGWKVGAAKYADNGSWKIADAKASITAETLGWDGKFTLVGISTSPDKIDAETIVNKDIAFEGATTYYVFTSLVAEVSWMIPTVNEETGELTGEYEVTTQQKSFGYDTEDKAKNLNVTFSEVKAPMGYTHSGWLKNGEAAEYGYYGIAISYEDGAKVEIKAVFEETDFQVIFNLRNGDFVQKIELVGEQKLGDVITIDGDLNLKDAAGANDYPFASEDKVLLPEEGVENSEQANGGYFNRNGYAFAGWYLGYGMNETDVDFTNGVEITPELVKTYGTSGKIEFNAAWEALEYELKFYYTMSDGSESEPYIIKLKVGEAFTKPNATNAPELFEKINANAPEGKSFAMWKCEGEDTGRMPAYGREYRATYLGQMIEIYIDYNHGKTVDTEGNEIPVEKVIRKYIGGSAVYGDDVERAQDVENNIEMGIGRKIMNSHIADADRPGEGYEIARWNRYHVKADGNIYDSSTWKSGINDAGSTTAQDTIIYQVEWIAHTDMFWRVYDTDGYICKAMGKDFKLYYWNKGNVAERADAQVNRNKDGLVVLMYIPTLEGWDWDRFFECDMWSNLTLRIDPLKAPKSMFTIESMIALAQALGNAIKELIASA